MLHLRKTLRPQFMPMQELYNFAEKSKKATFICEPYEKVFSRARKGSVIYCDPPYAPISVTANFNSYSKAGFSLEDQTNLASIANKTAKDRGIAVLISNHDTEFTRKIYLPAQINTLQVSRTISQNAEGRKKVSELLAFYPSQKA